ncbi:hypothetical protein [Rhodobium gokarnense]|uniref:Uncharacterized protein n=1 Tax=Rhodobium gokarnense TaxID=364296 RepID=A0ABT3HD66_9HYPH|nr:hypothetical protein [Rhodobium gokarnense]MCW2308279.1 hypothetical protein [Rhodobium gokarnense]
MSGRGDIPNDPKSGARAAKPTDVQRRYLESGLDQPGGKLPLFDANGRRYSAKTVEACIANGWAEHWFANPLKPDWLVCKLTPAGYAIVGGKAPGAR